MDTFCEISCYSNDRDKTVAAMDAAFREMQRIESVFSKFDENSAVSKINRLAGLEKVAVSEEVFKLTERAVYYSRISDGAFDITVAPLMDIWGFVRRHKAIPDKEAIDNALRSVGYKDIELDSKESSIRFLNKGKLLKSFELNDRAISTSGNYERFFEIGGKRYSHIINPVTGEPCQGIISVTVVADSAEKADALSTAIFVMGEKNGLTLAKSIKDIKVLILKEDGKIILYP